MIYADARYYTDIYGGTIVPPDLLQKQLLKASKQIDTLTFCRINRIGFDNLTIFQQDQIQYVTCLMAEFLHENEDELESMLSSYGINGVSMTFSGGLNVKKVQGIIIRTDIYAELAKTGLCSRRI